MASGASAPRPFPCCYRVQPAVPLAGVWRLGATDDAHAADRECGVLPALLPESRGGGRARAGPALTFRYQFYTFSGDRPPSAGVGGLPPGMMPRRGGILTDPPSLPAWVTESDIDVYVREYARSGFHGPLAWWRNIDRGWELMAPFAGAAVTVPALYMAGERDFVSGAFSRDIPKQ